MLQTEKQKAICEIGSLFDELKNSIPGKILKLPMGELKKLTNFNDILIEEKMNNLNVTVMDTLQRADEGEYNDGIVFGASVSSSSSRSSFIFHFLFVVI